MRRERGTLQRVGVHHVRAEGAHVLFRRARDVPVEREREGLERAQRPRVTSADLDERVLVHGAGQDELLPAARASRRDHLVEHRRQIGESIDVNALEARGVEPDEHLERGHIVSGGGRGVVRSGRVKLGIVNAQPLLVRVAHALARAGLEAVLIGNAAAALHGAPVTTLDFDFMFRKTPTNLRKLKVFADALSATILRPYYPVSDLFGVVSDDLGLQVDFMATIHGVRTFESLRSRAVAMKLADTSLCVAALRDIVRSKRAAGRPKDYAVLEILETTLDESEKVSAAADASPALGRSRPRK